MKERPIIFSGEMVRAILDGRKTQTRRVVKPQPNYSGTIECDWLDACCEPREQRYGFESLEKAYPCPYGGSGNRLWVREIFSLNREEDPLFGDVYYWADAEEPIFGIWSPPRPAIFMPKKYARIWLEITNVRVERVQDISEEDAIAEGCSDVIYRGGCSEDEAHPEPNEQADPRLEFVALWNSINAKRGFGWNANPYCWVISFRRIDK